MSVLSPIILFVYNRPDHTRQTLDSLAANYLASDSDLFIYSDAPKNQQGLESVQAVRSMIKETQGFKSVTIKEREKNWGLANSIIDGVTSIVNKYGKVIVLEDDIVTSPYFLQFMNKALNYYEAEKKVWHISGWNCLDNADGLEDAFFWRTMDCWGWATWNDRWQYFEKDANKLIHEFKKKDIYKFNMNNSENIWWQVLANKSDEINTWAVFWYATIFKNKGLCLNPTISFVRNIGFDGTGTNCVSTSMYLNNYLSEKDINFNSIIIKENDDALKRIVSHYKKYKKNMFIRIINKANNLIKSIIKK